MTYLILTYKEAKAHPQTEVYRIPVTAEELVIKMGHELIGHTIITPEMGTYPGGPAIVTEVKPDPGAPEIVCTARHPRQGEIGIFGYEVVMLIEDTKG